MNENIKQIIFDFLDRSKHRDDLQRLGIDNPSRIQRAFTITKEDAEEVYAEWLWKEGEE